MPKYPVDRRRYYDDMSDPGRARSRTYARGRSSDDQRREDVASHSDRSRQPPMRPGPSSGSSYSRSSSSIGTSGGYPSSARGEQHRSSERPSTSATHSDTMSETASVTGSIGGDVGTVGRGALRGRRMLPVTIITRPRHIQNKQGTHGKPIILQANYFKLLSATDWSIFQYRVDYKPEQDHTVVKKALLRSHQNTIGPYIFDGSVLYTSRRIEGVNSNPLELISTLRQTNEPVVLSIKSVGEMTRGDSHYIQFFNIIMRKCLDYLQLQLVGRNYFDPHNRAEIREHRLEIWPGYVTSIRQHENDILMCAEIANKVMRRDTLLDILRECGRENNHEYRKIFNSTVIGNVVLTDYNNNTYKVDDVDWNKNPRYEFEMKKEKISIFDYYQRRYNITIRDMNQPLLLSKSKARDRRAGRPEFVFLVPELCRSTGLTDHMRKNFKLMSSLAQYTRVSPANRIKKLKSFNDRLMGVPNVVQELNNWNLQLDRELVNIPARVIEADDIIFSNKITVKVSNDAKWTKESQSKPLLTTGILSDWAVIVPYRLKRDCQSFVTTLIRVAGAMKFNIIQPKYFEIDNDNPCSYADILDRIWSQMSPRMIFCVVSNNRADRYSAIKRKCCIDRPVPTQVVIAKNLSSKSQMSIATKVAVQMNCKIGGSPWTINIPLKGLMVVGFDVCHDPKDRARDYGAFVASISNDFGRYYSAVSNHGSGEELSNYLSVNLCKALNLFKKYNGALPKRIIIYRDGVGEGQLHQVYNHEVVQVKSKLATVYDKVEDIKLAYIIVTKKINTRFFHNGENPPPGTIVDDVVTDPTKFDFFIVAQHVNQGTVTPTAYNIIEDTSALDVDKLQRLTYKLCHMYFNWSGTVRVPAPCQYAHKLAFLVSQAIHETPSTQLETLLYFL